MNLAEESSPAEIIKQNETWFIIHYASNEMLVPTKCHSINQTFSKRALRTGLVKRKGVIQHAQNVQIKIYTAHAQKSHPGSCSPFIQSTVSNDSICGQRRP